MKSGQCYKREIEQSRVEGMGTIMSGAMGHVIIGKMSKLRERGVVHALYRITVFTQ